MTKPNLFLIGAPKSGTTALAYNLSQHKDIFIPESKEPRYFDANVFYDNEEDHPIKSLQNYLALYSGEDARACRYRIDASVFNMYSLQSIKSILELSPDAKFIIILRDPVSASISMHKQRLKYPDNGMRELSSSFLDCWRMLDERKLGRGYPKGCVNKFLFRYDLMYSYELYVPQLMKAIPKSQFRIIFYDEFKSFPTTTYEALFKFLEIEHIYINNKTRNESIFYKNSIFLNFIFSLAQLTLPLRRKAGLYGNNINKIKTTLLSPFESTTTVLDPDLTEVELYFSSTRQYMKSLKNNYSDFMLIDSNTTAHLQID